MKSIDELQNSGIQSWADLCNLIEKCSSGGWIFRGETKENNILRPKAGRAELGPQAARKLAYDLEDEKKALHLFKLQARPYIGHAPTTEIEWLAIAQHHGMSTRLLDWTESLLVAAYFATVNAGINSGKKCNGVIYGVRNVDTLSAEEETSPFSVNQVKIYHPPHISPRIPAQRSIFTIHPNPEETFNPSTKYQWVISSDVCGKIKKILDTCAINESSLFPDLDGLSRYLGWRYKWGKFN